MKRVSIKVAKALKKAGYSQVITVNTEYYTEDGINGYVCPYISEVCEWLWKEKKIFIDIRPYDDKFRYWPLYYTNKVGEITTNKSCWVTNGVGPSHEKYNTPEDATVAAIEYLVENNVIQ